MYPILYIRNIQAKTYQAPRSVNEACDKRIKRGIGVGNILCYMLWFLKSFAIFYVTLVPASINAPCRKTNSNYFEFKQL